MNNFPLERLSTGIKNLDAIMNGGIPLGSVILIGGTPGAGKTTLAQQICFSNCSAKRRALIFQTLSEPAAKTMKYMKQFEFFDAKKLNNGVEIVDLGSILRSKGLGAAIEMLMEHIKRVQPGLVVIDSFKVFEDLAESKEELRKFSYEVAVQLMTWEITGFLLGEYGINEIQNNSLSSIIDGIISMTEIEVAGRLRRGLRILKMRGTKHDLESHLYEIGDAGISLPKTTSKRRSR